MKQNSKMTMKIELIDKREIYFPNWDIINSYERRFGKYEGVPYFGEGDKPSSETPMKLLEYNINQFKRFNSISIDGNINQTFVVIDNQR